MYVHLLLLIKCLDVKFGWIKENLPPSARTIPSIHRFLLILFQDIRLHKPSTSTNQAPGPASSGAENGVDVIQDISFPSHHNTSSNSLAPTKSRGFAFVIFSRTRDADALLERWSWARLSPSSTTSPPGLESSERNIETDTSGGKRDVCSEDNEIRMKTIEEATSFGFRCLSMRKWEKMKVEYLDLQQKLLSKTIASNQPSRHALASSTRPTTASRSLYNSEKCDIPEDASPYQPPPPPNASYPRDCLLFVKHVHHETNKTTLKHLFASAIGANASADIVDYVDYTKGLDIVRNFVLLPFPRSLVTR